LCADVRAGNKDLNPRDPRMYSMHNIHTFNQRDKRVDSNLVVLINK